MTLLILAAVLLLAFAGPLFWFAFMCVAVLRKNDGGGR